MKIRKDIALSDSGFVFDPATGDSFSTNPIGMEIIQMLRQGKSQKEVQTKILANYDIDEISFEKDFYDFLKMLGMLKLTDGHAKEKN